MSPRTVVLMFLAGLTVTAALAVGPPPEPALRRVLSGADAQQAARLLQEIARLEAAGQFEGALTPARQVAQLCARAQGMNHWQTISSRWEVQRLTRVAKLSVLQQTEYAAISELEVSAKALQAKGRYRDAEPLRRRILDQFQKVLGEDHPSTAISYNNLAYNLNAQGKYARAQPLYEKSLAILRKSLGEDHPATAISYNNLATNLSLQAKFAQAQPLIEKALAICRKVLGEEHPNTATSYNTAAINLNAQGKYALAQPLFEKALAIFDKTLGEDHPDTVTSYNNVAGNLDSQARFVQAQPLYAKALAICQKVFGEDHPATARGYNNLASNLNAQGKYTRAQPLYEKALTICRKTLGEEHPHTAASYNNVALNLDAQGKYARAQPLYEKTLAIKRKVLGEDHPDTATGYDNVAVNLHDQSKYADAQPLFEKALAIRIKVQGEDHPDTAISFNNLASNLHAQARYAQAHPLLEKALAIKRKALGEDHPDTASSSNSVAVNLNSQGKYAQAQPLFETALAIKRKALGEDHPDTATGLDNLAWNLSLQARYAQAQPMYEKALAIRRRALGEDHPDTASSYTNMARNLFAMGKVEEAGKMAEEACRVFQLARLHVGFTGLDRSTFSARESPQLLLAFLRARAGKSDAAWQALERHLARGLLDEVAARERVLPAQQRQELEDLRSRWYFLERQLLALSGKDDQAIRQQRDRLREQLERVGRDLGELHTRLSKEHGPIAGAVYDRKRIQASLPDDAAVLGWLDVAGACWACVLRKRGEAVWVRLPAGEKQDVRDLVLELARETDEAEPAWLPPARRLFDQRLAPLRKHTKARDGLPAVRHLIVLPCPALAGVPVEALLAAGGWDLVVSYTPSGTLFASLQERKKRGVHESAGLLGLGDPSFAGGIAGSERGAEPPSSGVYLSLVVSGSKAALAGLREGDVLLSYGKDEVSTAGELLAALVKHTGSKEDVVVRVWRAGRTMKCEVKPGSLEVHMSSQPAAEAVRTARETEALLRRTLRRTYQPLPGTRNEVESIAKLFEKADTLLGSRASEESLEEMARGGKLKGYRYLHLATHGHASEKRPLESYLALSDRDLPDPLPRVLSGKPAYRGALTAGQILGSWELDAELVVLSACESGLGPFPAPLCQRLFRTFRHQVSAEWQRCQHLGQQLCRSRESQLPQDTGLFCRQPCGMHHAAQTG